MKRLLALFDLEDVALMLGVGLLCGGLAMIYAPAGMMLAGGLILWPRFAKYIPRRKGGR